MSMGQASAPKKPMAYHLNLAVRRVFVKDSPAIKSPRHFPRLPSTGPWAMLSSEDRPQKKHWFVRRTRLNMFRWGRRALRWLFLAEHGINFRTAKYPARSFLTIEVALHGDATGSGVVFGQRSTTWEAGHPKTTPDPFPPIPPKKSGRVLRSPSSPSTEMDSEKDSTPCTNHHAHRKPQRGSRERGRIRPHGARIGHRAGHHERRQNAVHAAPNQLGRRPRHQARRHPQQTNARPLVVARHDRLSTDQDAMVTATFVYE